MTYILLSHYSGHQSCYWRQILGLRLGTKILLSCFRCCEERELACARQTGKSPKRSWNVPNKCRYLSAVCIKLE